MMRFSIGVLSMALLAGCAASIPPVEVTRFHTNAAIARAAVAIDAPNTLEAASYKAAVARDMAKLGFAAPLPGDQTPLRAKVSWTRTFREERKASPFSIGIGGGTGGRNVGIGGGVSIPIGSTTRKIIVTELFVQLVQVSENKPVWEGRAITEAPEKAPASVGGLAADKLSTALFAGFPGESGKTVLVK